MNDKIVKEHHFPHPMKMVWDAISKQEEISTWFLKADFQAQPGYEYTFTSENDDACTTIRGKVLKANPINELVYTWVVDGTEVITTVSWMLEEVDGGTHLVLEHSGISQYTGDTAVEMFESFNGGWNNCVSELDKFLIKVNA